MKIIYIFIFFVGCNLHSMSKSKMDLVSSESQFKNFIAGFKELKYEVQESPWLYSTFGTAYTILTVEMYRISPLLCLGVHALTTYPSLMLMSYILPSQAEQRKRQHKILAFRAIEDGDMAKVTEFATKTCYQESDLAALQQQNTEFLFEALDEYNGCFRYETFNHQQANNYLQAASIFLKHHADAKKASEVMAQFYMPKATEWLEKNAKTTCTDNAKQ